MKEIPLGNGLRTDDGRQKTEDRIFRLLGHQEIRLQVIRITGNQTKNPFFSRRALSRRLAADDNCFSFETRSLHAACPEQGRTGPAVGGPRVEMTSRIHDFSASSVPSGATPDRSVANTRFHLTVNLP